MPFYFLAVRPWVQGMKKVACIEIVSANQNGKLMDLSDVESVNDLMSKKAMPIRNISFRYAKAGDVVPSSRRHSRHLVDGFESYIIHRDETLGETLERMSRCKQAEREQFRRAVSETSLLRHQYRHGHHSPRRSTAKWQSKQKIEEDSIREEDEERSQSSEPKTASDSATQTAEDRRASIPIPATARRSSSDGPPPPIQDVVPTSKMDTLFLSGELNDDIQRALEIGGSLDDSLLSSSLDDSSEHNDSARYDDDESTNYGTDYESQEEDTHAICHHQDSRQEDLLHTEVGDDLLAKTPPRKQFKHKKYSPNDTSIPNLTDLLLAPPSPRRHPFRRQSGSLSSISTTASLRKEEKKADKLVKVQFDDHKKRKSILKVKTQEDSLRLRYGKISQGLQKASQDTLPTAPCRRGSTSTSSWTEDPSPPESVQFSYEYYAALYGNNSSTSHPDHIPEDSAVEQPSKKELAWGHVEIRGYALCLGDNPACAQGCPIQLDWRYTLEAKLTVNQFERMKSREHPRRLSSLFRQQVLLDWGFSIPEMRLAQNEVALVQKQRIRTVSRLNYMGFGDRVERIVRILPHTH